MLIDLLLLVKKYNIKINGVIHGGAHLCEEQYVYKQCGLNDDTILWIDANPSLCVNNNVLNYALSDLNDIEVILNITNNGQSSSILELDKHSNYYPNIVVVDKVSVKTKRLDSIIHDISKYNFINLDIQGHELAALKGLGDMINNIDYIYTEVNTESLYKDCCTLEQLDEYLKQYKFIRKEIKMTEYGWGDAFYIKEHLCNYVSINIKGGLGNQLFQIATLLSYAKKHNKIPIFDRKLCNEIHGNILYDDFPQLQKLIHEKTLHNYSTHYEDYNKYNEIPYYDCNILLDGYYNNEKYFIENKNDIITLYRNIFGLDDISIENSIAIHIRRGDYLKNQYMFNILDLDYYKKSLKLLNLYNDINYINIITEDIDWANENMPKVDLLSEVYKNINYINNGLYNDFKSISTCKYIVIANSTYSWWAAYLSKAVKIIYPLDWFNLENNKILQRYHVDKWIGISSKSISENINFINNLTYYGHHNDCIIYSTQILNILEDEHNNVCKYAGTDYEIIKYIYPKEIVSIYNNLITSSGILGLTDKCKLYSDTVIDLCKRYLIQITAQQRMNIEFSLGYKDANINIDLTKIPLYVISRPERREEMTKRFSEHGLTPIFMDAVKSDIHVSDGCAKAHLKTLEYAIDNICKFDHYKATYNMTPFMILEDDVKFTDNFKTILTVPKVCDTIYLGLSRYGVVDGYHIFGVRNSIQCQKDMNDYYQVFNMLSAHAILYINPYWVKQLIKMMKVGIQLRVINDICNARLQKNTNVLAVKHPWIIQDPIYNKDNTETIVSLTEYNI